jgi:hypothetical protein
MTRKLNRDISYNEEKLKNFIERSKIVHNNKYSYEKLLKETINDIKQWKKKE